MSSHMYAETKAERHLIPDVLNSLFFKKKCQTQSTLSGIILTYISPGYVYATVVIIIVYEALNANSALQ